MAEGITLLEAWIALHTKGPDAAQQRDVEKSLEIFRFGLAGLITKATEAAAIVTAATGEMAKGLFKTYYEAQRIGATVERVKAFGQAVEQAGGSAETATADLEKFSEKFRVNPAFREAIKNLGHLSAEDMKDSQTAYIAFSKALAEQRKTDPLQYGKGLKFGGLDEATVLAIGRPKFAGAYKDMLETDKGLDKIAEKSVRLREAWIQVNQRLNTIFTLASGKWMEIESGMLNRFDAFLEKHKELFVTISDSIASIFFDAKGKFDDTAFGTRVYNAFWDWIHSIDFTKLKNAFVAFADWLTTGWLADKIKGVFGSLGGAVRAAGEAVEQALGGGGDRPSADDSYALDHPGWRPGMPKEKTRAQKEATPAPAQQTVAGASPLAMPEPKTQEYIKKGGYGPFSHEQNVGAWQDFNIPGQSGFHPIAGKLDDFVKGKPRQDGFITHPDIHYDRDPNMPAIRDDPHGTIVEKLKSKKMEQQFFYGAFQKKIETMMQPRRPVDGGSRQWSRRDEGSKTQDIRVTINSTDPHSAASETARQLAHLQNHTMRDWRKVG